jgi:glutamyl-Q tRNA(Asp) synthetase
VLSEGTAPLGADAGAPRAYTGRFAPSPTGPLHAGSLVAALASWLDARANGGRWLVRIEDVDTPRCVPGAAAEILRQLARCGLVPDETPWWQSTRGSAYAQALQTLQAQGLAYPCGCTRKAIEAHWLALGVAHVPEAERIYPGTCRPERGGLNGKPARALRFVADGPALHWQDRRLGLQRQDVAAAVGDFVLQRADGLWAYQLAVVVDDAAQGITHVVRGEDLADNTARQLLLQRALGLPTPAYLHTPLVLAADGRKLSKQNGAAPLALHDPVAALRQAGCVLGLPPLQAPDPAQWLRAAVAAWAGLFALPP